MMKKIILNTMAAMIVLGYTNMVYASGQEIEPDLQNRKAQGKLDHFHYLDQLPTEIESFILQSVHAKDLKKLRHVCHKWYGITGERNFWIKVAQRINPDIDNDISDKSLKFLKRFLLGNFILVTGFRESNDLASEIPRYGIIKIPGSTDTDAKEWSAQFSSADGMIRAGTTEINGCERAFITTDLKTMKVLPIPDTAKEMNVKTNATGISVNGHMVVGNATASIIKIVEDKQTRQTGQLGFYWSEKEGMQFVAPENAVTTFISCINQDAHISGGNTVKVSNENATFDDRTAALFLDHKYLFVFQDWLAAIDRPRAEIFKYSRVNRMNHDDAPSGIYYSSSKDTSTSPFYWSIVFHNFDNYY